MLELVIPPYLRTNSMLNASRKNSECAPHAVDLRYSYPTTASHPKLASAGAAPVYKVIRTSRLYEQIVQQIEESVLNGTLKPGDQLPAERELAQRLGVSRTAVREAVKTLREKGLVEAYSGRGTFITDGTSQAARQSFDLMVKLGQPEGSPHLAELRLILEPGIAAFAALRAEEEHMVAMREAVAVMDRAQRDPEAYIEADLDFHLALAEAAANPLILSLIDSIVGLLREQRIKIFNVEGGPQRGQIHHKQILAAIEQHDPEMARAAMRSHLEQVREDSKAPLGVHSTHGRRVPASSKVSS
jgi:GntR family transcriptional regulator, transcriptional repressor for pyruvate dehydrogenase complex